jgi:hypothetical protein
MQLIPELAAMVATMTAQMAKQRKRAVVADASTDTGFVCRYRGLDGCKCAVGALFPDELYDPRLEVSVTRLFNWTYDEEAIRHAKACKDADSVEPAAKLVRHLASMAPSVSHVTLLHFLSACQHFHDSPTPETERYSYESVMTDAPDDVTDEDLQERLTKRLIGHLVTHHNNPEFWVKPCN